MNEIVGSLDPEGQARYGRLVELTDVELREFLLTVNPTVAAALTLHLLDRVAGYRKALDGIGDRVRSNGVDTSDEAARKVSKSVSGIRARVLVEIARLEDDPGVPAPCSDAVEASLGMKHQTCSTRFMELREAGYIERTERVKTRAGNDAWGFGVTEDGRRMLRSLLRTA